MIPVVRQNNWLPGILNDFFGNEWVERQTVSSPAVNIIENDKQYKVEIAAPGLTKNDFKIDVHENNHLVVSVEKKNETKEENKGNKYLRHEFAHSSFRQIMVLPDQVDKDNIKAKMEDGVLNIEIPKIVREEKAQPVRTIDIQ
ncbi:MAG: Hsp20/alpha crystallin family protein [Dysgonamonadaceae bacterium]|jgi:HSP20 family protein|nr:Hsp20/alpha crystallin family protein [Dysgonamonadaceae bacterium]